MDCERFARVVRVGLRKTFVRTLKQFACVTHGRELIVQAACQIRRLQGPDSFEIPKPRLARAASSRKTVPRWHMPNSNQERTLIVSRGRRVADSRGLGHFRRIIFQVAIQAGPPNPQNLRGAQAVSLAQVQHAMDMDLAHFFQG